MPRKNLIRTNLYYYHITTRVNHKHWFCLPLNEVWKISISSFQKAQKNCASDIAQFVLMGNHYHLLIRTPNSDIDKFMFWFNKTMSDLLRYRSGLENRMFGSSYKWSLIKSNIYLFNVYRYIYQNPIRAGLVNRCEDYMFSSLFFLRNNKELGFQLEPIIEYEQSDFNHLIESDEVERIRLGLRKTIFKPVLRRR